MKESRWGGAEPGNTLEKRQGGLAALAIRSPPLPQHTHTCSHTRKFACMNGSMHMHKRVPIRSIEVRMLVPIFPYICAYMQVHGHTHAHTLTGVHTHRCTHTQERTRTGTHTYTHTQAVLQKERKGLGGALECMTMEGVFTPAV